MLKLQKLALLIIAWMSSRAWEAKAQTVNLAWCLVRVFVRRHVHHRSTEKQIVDQWLEAFWRLLERPFDAIVLQPTTTKCSLKRHLKHATSCFSCSAADGGAAYGVIRSLQSQHHETDVTALRPCVTDLWEGYVASLYEEVAHVPLPSLKFPHHFFLDFHTSLKLFHRVMEKP